jgi:hypothetical protein
VAASCSTTGKIDATGRLERRVGRRSSVEGKLSRPLSPSAVAMEYDAEKVTSPPKTTDELLAFVPPAARSG